MTLGFPGTLTSRAPNGQITRGAGGVGQADCKCHSPSGKTIVLLRPQPLLNGGLRALGHVALSDKIGSSLPRWRAESKGLGAISSGGSLHLHLCLWFTHLSLQMRFLFPLSRIRFCFSTMTSNTILRANMDFFFSFHEMSLKDELAWS